jgi:hypothetical protein
LFEAFDGSTGSNGGDMMTAGQFNGSTYPGSEEKVMSVSRTGNRVMGPDDGLPCPLGYSLSGNMCYENCPPDFTDVGDKCKRGPITLDRPSYDRGSGVPYIRRTPKFFGVNRAM